MRPTTLALLMALVLAPACTNAETEAAASARRAATGQGHALLDEYVGLFRSLAQSGSAEPFLEAFAEHEQKVRRLAADGKLEANFAARHLRLVDVTRLMISSTPDDATRRAKAEQITAFVREVAGPDAPPIDPNAGLSAVAELLVEEVLNQHMLLEGETDREKARAKWIGSGPL